MTTFYAHQSVNGTVFWGFWDDRIREPEAAKFTGENVVPNAAGLAYQELYHNTWRTHVYRNLIGQDDYTVRGFNGDYLLKVKHNGVVIKTKEFQLTEGGTALVINLNGDSGQFDFFISIRRGDHAMFVKILIFGHDL